MEAVIKRFEGSAIDQDKPEVLLLSHTQTHAALCDQAEAQADTAEEFTKLPGFTPSPSCDFGVLTDPKKLLDVLYGKRDQLGGLWERYCDETKDTFAPIIEALKNKTKLELPNEEAVLAFKLCGEEAKLDLGKIAFAIMSVAQLIKSLEDDMKKIAKVSLMDLLLGVFGQLCSAQLGLVAMFQACVSQAAQCAVEPLDTTIKCLSELRDKAGTDVDIFDNAMKAVGDVRNTVIESIRKREAKLEQIARELEGGLSMSSLATKQVAVIVVNIKAAQQVLETIKMIKSIVSGESK